MNTKTKQLISIIVFVVGFILLDLSLQKYEVVIQPPIIIREKNIVSPMTEEQVKKMIEDRREITSKPVKVVLAKSEIERIDTTTETIIKWAKYYGVSPEFGLCVAFHESSMNPLAVGDSGKARGLFQFWAGTWEMFRKKMGESTQDMRVNVNESSKTAMWAISEGYGSHWSVITNGLCK